MKKFTSIFLIFLGVYWLFSFIQQGSFWSIIPALISFLTSFLLLSNYSSNLLEKLLISTLVYNFILTSYQVYSSTSVLLFRPIPIEFFIVGLNVLFSVLLLFLLRRLLLNKSNFLNS